MLDQPPFFGVAGAKFCACPFPRDNRLAGATDATWLGDPLTRDAVARCLAVRRDVIVGTLAAVFCVGPDPPPGEVFSIGSDANRAANRAQRILHIPHGTTPGRYTLD